MLPVTHYVRTMNYGKYVEVEVEVELTMKLSIRLREHRSSPSSLDLSPTKSPTHEIEPS